MPGGFAPRFAIEAGFLIALGVGAGLADLRSAVIVALLAGGWALVTLLELAFWRAEGRLVSPVPPPPPPAPEEEHGWPPEETAAEPADVAYPLRSDAGAAVSEEVEAYTRILDGDAAEPEDGAPGERAE
jgi:hypothetical protein